MAGPNKEHMVISAIISEARTQSETTWGHEINSGDLIDSLFNISAEAREVCLHWLQRRDNDAEVRLINFFHDVNGLAAHDKYFLPRIEALQKFAD